MAVSVDTIAFAVFLVGFVLGLIHMLAFCGIFLNRLVNGETMPVNLKEIRQIEPPWLRRLQRIGLAFMGIGTMFILGCALWSFYGPNRV